MWTNTMLTNNKVIISIFKSLFKIIPVSQSVLEHLSISRPLKRNLVSDWTEIAFDFEEATRKMKGILHAKQK